VVEVDGNAYSVPWRLIGETVEVTVAAGQVRVRHGTREVAVHEAATGKRHRVMDAAHLEGVAGSGPRPSPGATHAHRRRRVSPPLSQSRRCCARSPSTRPLWGEASDAATQDNGRTDARPARRYAGAPQADGHPRPARYAAGRGAARASLTTRETLALLCEGEIARKDHRRIDMTLKLAHFPVMKDLASFDFAAQPSVDQGQMRDLAAGRWIANGENLLLLGPQIGPLGVGKTHLAVALGREAILAGYAVQFALAATLVASLAKAHAERRLEEKLTALAKPRQLIVDEINEGGGQFRMSLDRNSP
jgi:IstB-like ATP binding protein/Mu transposase-like protein